MKLQEVLGNVFDSNAVEPTQSFDLLPAGMYSLEITDAEVIDTKKGDGKMLKVTHDVIDPAEFAGRKLWKRINLRNPNPQAEQIGQAELSSLCRSVGIGTLQDTDELVGKIVRGKVTVKPAKDGYEAQNEIKAYESAQAAAKPAAKPAPAPAAKSAPWAKKAA